MAKKRRNLSAMLMVLSILLLVPCGLTRAGSGAGAETPLPEPDITLFQEYALEQAESVPPAVLGQAASLCKKVLFLDDRAEGEYSELKSVLMALGFEVQEVLPSAITASLIAPYDVVVFSLGWYAGGGGQREITDAETAALVQYVNSGKSLFLVGELGRASWSGKWRKSLNRIAVNFGIAFDNNMLCSSASHLSDPADPDGGVDLPIISDLRSSLLGEGVGQFSLFWGSTVRTTPPARTVARSDSGGWKDIDCTWNFVINEWECEQDLYEPSARRPVMALAESGAGRILAIGDSSWLMNGWIDYTDNLQLAKNVFAWLARLPAVKSLTAKPPAGATPLAVEFTCRLKDPGTRVAAVRWDFGDGTTVTNTLIGENVRTIPQGHVYPSIGTYAATCTVVDKGGCSSTSQPSVVTVANPTQVTIRGRVTDSEGTTGIGNVIMTGLPGSPATDVNGNYTATVPYGWSGTATPTLAGRTFTPPTRTYRNVTANLTGQDYTGVLINLTISGQVSFVGGQGGIAGVVMSGLPGNPVTGRDGSYTATVTYGWSGTVTPTMTGWTFTEPSRTYANVTANLTGQDYSGALIILTISGQVTDSAGAAVSNVTMAGLPGNPVTDAGGFYSGTVTYGWSGTVTPTQAEQSFLPQSRSYSNVTSNQTGQDYLRTIYLSIEGYVRNSNEAGISGVVMTGLPGNPTTNADGFYSAMVPSGWTGTVTPTLNGRSFTPGNRSYTNVTSDWFSQSYMIADVTISGRIHGDILNDPPDVAISMVGFPTAVTTDTNGNYSGAVPYGWTGTITPTQLGYTFTPLSRPYTGVTSDRSGEDYTFPDIF